MDYKKNLPGETPYDKPSNGAAYEGTTAGEQADRTSQEPPQSENAQGEQRTHEQQAEAYGPSYGSRPYQPPVANPGKTPDLKHQFAIASMILGISSFLVIFVIPLFGIALASVGGIFGIVFGALSRKQYPGFAWTGIILSILALVIVLICFILLCVLGWGLITALLSGLPQGPYTFPRGFYNGFYLP